MIIATVVWALKRPVSFSLSEVAVPVLFLSLTNVQCNFEIEIIISRPKCFRIRLK